MNSILLKEEMLRDDFHNLGYMYGSLIAHASEKWKHDKHIQVGTI